MHRIDQAQVRRELEAAGFVLDGESQVLRNPADNRSLRVFEGDIRGRTDQFVLRFRKPAVNTTALGPRFAQGPSR